MTKTRIVRISDPEAQKESLQEAGNVLSEGGLVVIPTETVYGIAANLRNKQAVARLNEIKGRSKDKPFSLHLEKKEKIDAFAKEISVAAYKLIYEFLPGPLTLVLKSRESGTIGIRIPDHEIALSVIGFSGVPVVCPSANLSGNPAPISFPGAIKDLDGLVDFAIDAGETKLGRESTVVDATVDPVRVLREGAIKSEMIENTAKKKSVLFVCTGNSCRSVMAKALLEKKLKEAGREDVEVLSAGIMMLNGMGATEQTRAVLSREGIDVSGHKSQRITKELAHKSDIILVMEKLHEERLLQLVPEIKNRVFLLKEFAQIDDHSLNIEDPIGMSLEFYQKTMDVIKGAVERIIKII